MILVPEKVKIDKLPLTNREPAQVTLDLNRKDEETKTIYCSVHLDIQMEEDLLNLDDETFSVKSALIKARADSSPVLLTYGLGCNTIVKAGWDMLNEAGWGACARYVGDVRNGTPHGSESPGERSDGKCDGSGELSAAEVIAGIGDFLVTPGTFILGVCCKGLAAQLRQHDVKSSRFW